MAEPERQIEVQLGHLCNNRCVFCVSGQLSEQKRAPQLPSDPIREQIEAARAGGARKITFLGGEPTIQRSFPELLQRAVELDFDEIVLFTNGVMTPRESFRSRVFRILEGLSGDVRKRVIWRFSLQGGDEAHHDATTMNPGSWSRIRQSLEVLKGQGARLTGNMCVVESNYRSTPALAEVAAKFGFENLHLDMVRPRDAGDRTTAELRGMMAKYSDMVPYFREMIAATDRLIGEDFDINLGNLPYCVAPDLAHKIHHDGESTITVAASGQGTTQVGFDKYADKRVDKEKIESCASCIFDGRCSGVFERYGEFHGYDELQPLDAAAMWRLDARGNLFVLLAEQQVRDWAAEGLGRQVGLVDERAASIDVAIDLGTDGPRERWSLVLQRAGRALRRGGWAVVAGERVEAVLLGTMPTGAAAIATLVDALNTLDRSLGGAGLAADATAGLVAAWERERGRRGALAARRREQVGIAQRTVERLRGAELAGMRPAGVERTADGAWATLRYEDDAGAVLELDVGLEPPAEGRPRPIFRHRTANLPDERLAAANAALAARLRGAIRA